MFLALAKRMKMENGVTPFRGSVREVAEIAAMSKNTAHTGLLLLSEDGLICIHVPDDSSAHRYSFTVDLGDDAKLAAGSAEVRPIWDSRSLQGCRLTPTVPSSPHPPQSHDAFQVRALGKSAYSVYVTLLDNPGLTTGEMAMRTGRHKRTVEKALGRLELQAWQSPTTAPGPLWRPRRRL